MLELARENGIAVYNVPKVCLKSVANSIKPDWNPYIKTELWNLIST